jgi:hypothetical protein
MGKWSEYVVSVKQKSGGMGRKTKTHEGILSKEQTWVHRMICFYNDRTEVL